MRFVYKVISTVLVALFMLQTGAFVFAGIARADSVFFRLIVGFVGIGLVIVPSIMTFLSRSGKEKGAGAMVLDLASMVFMVAGPWIRLDFLWGVPFDFSLEDMAVANMSMSLACACLGFGIVGLIAGIKPPPYAGHGLEPSLPTCILRVVISLVLAGTAFYAAYPVLCFAIPGFSRFGLMPTGQGSFAVLVAWNAGNPWVWLVNLLIGTTAYFLFYKRWIIDGVSIKP